MRILVEHEGKTLDITEAVNIKSINLEQVDAAARLAAVYRWVQGVIGAEPSRVNVRCADHAIVTTSLIPLWKALGGDWEALALKIENEDRLRKLMREKEAARQFAEEERLKALGIKVPEPIERES